MFHCWKERNEVETSPSIFPDPAGGYKYPETKNVSAILYRRSPFERPCRVADTKRLCFRTTFLPVSTLRQSVLDFALPHAARPSLRWTGTEYDVDPLADYDLPTHNSNTCMPVLYGTQIGRAHV